MPIEHWFDLPIPTNLQSRIPSLHKIAESFKIKGLIEAFNGFANKQDRDAGASTSSTGESYHQMAQKRPLSPSQSKHTAPTKLPHLSNETVGNSIEQVFLPPAYTSFDPRRTNPDDASTLRKFRQTFDSSNQPKLFEILARIETKLDTLGRNSHRSVPIATPTPSTQTIPNPKPTPQKLKPITAVEELDELENKLADEGYWNAVVSR